MPLALPTDRAFRSTAELRSLVAAVRDAPPEEMEQDWIEWKAAAKLGDKSAACDMSRYIIGVANRSPDDVSVDAAVVSAATVLEKKQTVDRDG